MVSLASDIAIRISALVAVGAAFLGLPTWRRELTGEAQFDSARNVESLASELSAGLRKTVYSAKM